MYDNETQKHVDLDNLCENADWYTDNDNLLYIVPHNIDAANIAPDNAINDAINTYCRIHGYTPDSRLAYQWLDLNFIPVHLRRFNETDGYYTA